MESKQLLAMNKSSPAEIRAIILAMMNDQREHTYATITEIYLRYRKPVVEWMLDVCGFFKLHVTTAHAAVSYLDRLQPTDKFSRQEWQMIAIACILVASKYNECEEDVPPLGTLEEIIQHGIPNDTILNYELWALKRMSWLLNARTPIAFLSAYSALSIIFPSDQLPSHLYNSSSEMSMISESFDAEMAKLATLCLLDTKYKKYMATDIAGSLLYLFRENVGIIPVWNHELTAMTYCDPVNDSNLQEIISSMRSDLTFDSFIYLQYHNSKTNITLDMTNTTDMSNSSSIEETESSFNHSETSIHELLYTSPLRSQQRGTSNMQSPVILYMNSLHIGEADSSSTPVSVNETEPDSTKENYCHSMIPAVGAGEIIEHYHKRTSPVSVGSVGQLNEPELSETQKFTIPMSISSAMQTASVNTMR